MIDLEHGDCLKLMPKLPSHSIDLILADPPYSFRNKRKYHRMTLFNWDVPIPLKPMWKQYDRIIKPHGAILIFGSEPFLSEVRLSNLKEYRYDWIWEKTHPTLFQWSHHRPMGGNELIAVFYKHLPTYNPQMRKGSPYVWTGPQGKKPGSDGLFNKNHMTDIKYHKNNGTRFPTTVIKFSNKNNKRYHPTQKPLPLLRYLIRTYTDAGDTVLDNCMGSGSTGVACKELHRSFIGMEITSHYYGIAKKRIRNVKRSDTDE